MRPPRLIALVFVALASVLLLSRALTSRSTTTARPPTSSRYASESSSSPSSSSSSLSSSSSSSSSAPSASAPHRQPHPHPQPARSIMGLFYYNTPFSLFPPNAAISLTDDNSTSFAARPAAFGPKLASKGLSGQLWVGTGFTDDTVDTIGELGCSDIPGWDDGDLRVISSSSSFLSSLSSSSSSSSSSLSSSSSSLSSQSSHQYDSPLRDDEPTKRPNSPLDARQLLSRGHPGHIDDGTDDHLHRTLQRRDAMSATHADIQSIQEGAEIEGKIVLLMRGGCGFLEKVMWAQRRGAIAVIVGDNQRGGPLIQMFAHGDEVDNVTIPSVFTARTSAQLLSALTQPGNAIEDALRHDDDRRSPPGLLQGKTFARTNKAAKGATKGAVTSHAGATEKNSLNKNRNPAKPKTPTLGKQESPDGPQGGIVAPGSGEYKADAAAIDAASRSDSRDGVLSKAIFSKLFGADHTDDANPSGEDDEHDPPKDGEPLNPPRDGLWVTITPTSSASPFFDTLLVLVISPLVTLTIVYALLILRARIRRRRWRAPKSVVDRLPVRTYHTVARSPSLSPRLPSPSSSSPTTPLLQQSPSRSRPRSQTTTAVPERGGLLISNPDPTSNPGSSAQGPSSSRPGGSNAPPTTPRRPTRQEKGAAAFSAEWKKYMGRQVECVVCLEEYIDGVSRVMRLPCGHEFHADCITPWLTTRRRTCPICKGDVVRSMTRGSWAVPRYEPYQDDSEDVEAEGSGTGSGSGYQSTGGSGSGSGSGSGNAASNAAQGSSEAASGPSEPRRPNWQVGWLGILSNSFGGSRPSRSQSPSPEDRHRSNV